jgi:sec-independent protein translocase protein TatA
MGIENPVHLAFIAIVALLVLGPKRLPELARALGHGIREFREAVGAGAEQTITQQPAVQPPVAREGGDGFLAEKAGAAPRPAVDPAEPVRSDDAPDSGPL